MLTRDITLAQWLLSGQDFDSAIPGLTPALSQPVIDGPISPLGTTIRKMKMEEPMIMIADEI